MPEITLPDGSRRSYGEPPSVAEVAADIGPGLARAALAGRVAGQLVDTDFRIENDAEVAIVTARDADGLEILRHSTAHLLAQAVQELFPGAQVTIGPVIEDGFYYDFSYERGFTPEDLESIEKRMKELAKADLSVSRETVARDDAVEYSSPSASTTRPKSSPAFRGTRPLRCTARANGRTSAAVRMCRPPGTSRLSS